MRIKKLCLSMFILSLLSLSFVAFLLVIKLRQFSDVDHYYYEQNNSDVQLDNFFDKNRTAKDNDNNKNDREKIGSNSATKTAEQRPIQQVVIPVLVIAAKRANAISNHLRQLTRIRPSHSQFPIIVSQDGDSQEVTDAITAFVQREENVHLIKHANSPTKTSAYFRISQHYKFALDKVFTEMGFELAIVTEDDLDVADDFFSYFSALHHLLTDDPTIWCVSAWNDNGNPSIVDWTGGQQKLWRTDFFPGLGWMLRVETWRELVKNWPDEYWDDWLRRPDIRKNRVCIRPEQSRTLHNLQVAGKGTSGALYKTFLSSMRLPERRVDFEEIDLDFLHKSAYDRRLSAALNASIEMPLQTMLNNLTEHLPNVTGADQQQQTKSLKVIYKDPREFRQLAKKFNLMADIRSGMPRTAYYGVVPFYQHNMQMFAVHAALNWTNDFDSRNSSDVYQTDWDLKSKFLDFAESYCVPKRWNGICDPYDPKMRAWFTAKGWSKRLNSWLPMTVF